MLNVGRPSSNPRCGHTRSIFSIKTLKAAIDKNVTLYHHEDLGTDWKDTTCLTKSRTRPAKGPQGLDQRTQYQQNFLLSPPYILSLNSARTVLSSGTTSIALMVKDKGLFPANSSTKPREWLQSHKDGLLPFPYSITRSLWPRKGTPVSRQRRPVTKRME